MSSSQDQPNRRASSTRLTENAIGWTVLVLSIAVVALFPVPAFILTQANYIGLAALVGVGLVLLTGVAGMTSFGQAAFVGVAAYTTALLALHAAAPAWLTLLAALAATSLVALVLGVLTLRLSGHFLPLGTLAWALAIYYSFSNSDTLGKFDGLSGIPPLSLFGATLGDTRSMFVLIWGFVSMSLVLAFNLLDSRTGRAIRALKEAEAVAESCGIHTGRYRLVVFVYSAAMASLAGWLYAYLQRGVNPTPFGLNASIEYLFMTVIGGVGSLWGAITGAISFALVKDLLQRSLPAIVGTSGNYEAVAFGILILVLLHRAPVGLWPLLLRRVLRNSDRRKPAESAPEVASTLPRRAMPARDTLLLSAKGISKRFGGLLAVDALSLQVRAGEVVALIGPNGAGKSTTFNILTGVLELSAGEIQLHGATEPERIESLPARQIARRGIARTFQHARLIAGATVLDNVMLGAYLRGRAGSWRSVLRLNRAEEAQLRTEALHQLERVGLREYAYHEADTLALGQQRIVEIARALCCNPLLLLLDEPAAGLRHLEKEALGKLIVQLRAEGMSVLFVEHDMEFVMGLADRVYVMEFGKLIAQGSPSEIVNNPAVLEAYLGTPHEANHA